jgi:hypothetical protein
VLLGFAAFQAKAQGWSQAGGNPQHTGSTIVAAQPLVTILADVICDPFVEAEKAENDGELFVHYAAPLLEGRSAYVAVKTGRYVPCDPPGSGSPFPCGADAWGLQLWGVTKLEWDGGALVQKWNVLSDWKPEPSAGGLQGWEPLFQPVLTAAFLYLPAAGGSILKVDKTTGAVVRRLDPFAADSNTYVAGGLAADSSANIFYNAITLAPSEPWSTDVLGAWLVRISADDSVASVAFAQLTPNAPVSGDLCETEFPGTDLPWPPSAGAVAPTRPCGSQRAGINVTPAIATDGTIYTVSRAHLNSRYSFVVGATPQLTLLWAASLRDLLSDGCDVLLPPNGSPGGCRVGARVGVDPATNGMPAAEVSDHSTSSPVVLPDGSILYGAATSYNYRRGHLLHFGPRGQSLGAYDYGWDVTPSVFVHGGAWSLLLKDNHYSVGSYCDNPLYCPKDTGRYDVVSLTDALAVEWAVTNSTSELCDRLADGTVACIPLATSGFEWCVNQLAVDSGGTVYVNNEDGRLYSLGRSGNIQGSIFLNQALGAAYTPVAIGPDGSVYAQNSGHLFVIGDSARARVVAVKTTRGTHRLRRP